VIDRVETTSYTWLGLTSGCARCHDHKYDPISQKDYYSLLAFFNNTPVDGRGGSGQAAPVLDFATAENKAKLAELEAEVKDCGGKVEALEKKLKHDLQGNNAGWFWFKHIHRRNLDFIHTLKLDEGIQEGGAESDELEATRREFFRGG